MAVSIDCRNDAVRRTFEEACVQRGDYLVANGQGGGAADIVLLELDDRHPHLTFARIRNLLSASPGLEVFLTSSQTASPILLEAFRIGVKEFLPQPLTLQEAESALVRFEQRSKRGTGAKPSPSGRVVSVFGVQGGVGTSTVATNLAMSVQQASRGAAVALMDLDLHGGDLGLFLDLHAPQDLKYLAQDLSRLDQTIVQGSLVQHASGLRLLASGYEGFDEVQPAAGSAKRVIGLLRSMHPHVFVDCGHVWEPAVKEALDCSDQILIVTTLFLPPIRRTKRLLEVLHAAQYPPGKVRVIVNRYANDQQALLSETEELLGMPVAGLIPNDYETASEAINCGKPLTIMASRSTIGQWYLRGIDDLIGDRPAAEGLRAEPAQRSLASFLSRHLPGFHVKAGGQPSAA